MGFLLIYFLYVFTIRMVRTCAAPAACETQPLLGQGRLVEAHGEVGGQAGGGAGGGQR